MYTPLTGISNLKYSFLIWAHHRWFVHPYHWRHQKRITIICHCNLCCSFAFFFSSSLYFFCCCCFCYGGHHIHDLNLACYGKKRHSAFRHSHMYIYLYMPGSISAHSSCYSFYTESYKQTAVSKRIATSKQSNQRETASTSMNIGSMLHASVVTNQSVVTRSTCAIILRLFLGIVTIVSLEFSHSKDFRMNNEQK